ncbi:uncharacterized protein E6C27_scaffold22G004790 [Cucumis melo var. makuwa]|uniref:Uncharacterized protein n=1 Tax=Cucumis melo var. makuwa TaxID=1194695 RepID=A0A5A7UXL1_CUCMM|nr:uncharacterized protein E6C27_scaffold22G004790 [Cucumis melo var. makuwa]
MCQWQTTCNWARKTCLERLVRLDGTKLGGLMWAMRGDQSCARRDDVLRVEWQGRAQTTRLSYAPGRAHKAGVVQREMMSIDFTSSLGWRVGDQGGGLTLISSLIEECLEVPLEEGRTSAMDVVTILSIDFASFNAKSNFDNDKQNGKLILICEHCKKL